MHYTGKHEVRYTGKHEVRYKGKHQVRYTGKHEVERSERNVLTMPTAGKVLFSLNNVKPIFRRRGKQQREDDLQNHHLTAVEKIEGFADQWESMDQE